MSKLGAMHNVQRPRTETGEFTGAGPLLLVRWLDAPAGHRGKM